MINYHTIYLLLTKGELFRRCSSFFYQNEVTWMKTIVSSRSISLLQQLLMIIVQCRRFRLCAEEQQHLILVKLSSNAWLIIACMIDGPCAACK